MSYQKCRELFRVGVIDALELCKPHVIRLFVESDEGSRSLKGFALDILPWHTQACIAFRLESDPPPHEMGDWEHYQFFYDLTGCESDALGDAAAFAGDMYSNPPPGIDGGAMTHLILLAGAEALLDKSVAETFYSIMGIEPNSAVLLDTEFGGWIELMVLHPDQVCKSNYCDIIRMNRIMDQHLVKWS